MIILHLTETNGQPVVVAFPEGHPFVLRVQPGTDRFPPCTQIIFGSLWARVQEDPSEILALLKDEEG